MVLQSPSSPKSVDLDLSNSAMHYEFHPNTFVHHYSTFGAYFIVEFGKTIPGNLNKLVNFKLWTFLIFKYQSLGVNKRFTSNIHIYHTLVYFERTTVAF